MYKKRCSSINHISNLFKTKNKKALSTGIINNAENHYKYYDNIIKL